MIPNSSLTICWRWQIRVFWIINKYIYGKNLGQCKVLPMAGWGVELWGPFHPNHSKMIPWQIGQIQISHFKVKNHKFFKCLFRFWKRSDIGVGFLVFVQGFFFNSKWRLFQNSTYSLPEKPSKIESKMETLQDLSQISAIRVCIFKHLLFFCFQTGKTRHQNINISHLNVTPSFSFLSHLL